ncbi:3'-5' exonuclease [Kribbella sp. NPDC006257]|uniref:3'-5' exonuclease n=1 Tax=Kribbella sp. NPDC006257 TaxID=3156738 RepID=UPI0033A7571E
MNTSTWPELLVIDVEGNGANPPDLVEVAALPIRNGRPDTSTAGAWLIRPPIGVSPFVARIHGLTNAVLANEPTWDTVASDVAKHLGESWICAHNAHVDYGVLSRHLPNWRPAGVIDTLRLARATWKGLPSYKLDTLIAHAELDLTRAPAQRHRATFDAYATSYLFLALAEHYPTWEALIAAAIPPGLPGAPEPEPEETLW